MILADKIIDWDDVGPGEYHNTGISYQKYLAHYHARRGLGPLPDIPHLDDWDKWGSPIVGYINYGQWLVECPTCKTAVIGCKHYPYFKCPGCGSGGKWSVVVYPDHEMQVEIERLLLNRPGFRTSAPSRNWVPPETTMDLRLQNIANGDVI